MINLFVERLICIIEGQSVYYHSDSSVHDTIKKHLTWKFESLKIHARDFSENLQIDRLGRFDTSPAPFSHASDAGKRNNDPRVRLNAAIYVSSKLNADEKIKEVITFVRRLITFFFISTRLKNARNAGKQSHGVRIGVSSFSSACYRNYLVDKFQSIGTISGDNVAAWRQRWIIVRFGNSFHRGSPFSTARVLRQWMELQAGN